MKRTILTILFVCVFVSTSFATYTYTITEYQTLPDLEGEDTMLITENGGGGATYLEDYSSLTIESTSLLGQGTGGVWEIHPGYNSSLIMSDGQVHEIAIINDATAFLSGGLIEQIWSQQIAWKQEGDPPAPVWNPHITIECPDPSYNDDTNLLTGHWLDDGTAFSIQLIDVDGYSPAIENIQFVPEPATAVLFGLSFLFLHRKKQ